MGFDSFFQNRIQNILPTIYRVLFDEFEKCALKSKRPNGRVRLREKEKEGSYCDIDDLVWWGVPIFELVYINNTLVVFFLFVCSCMNCSVHSAMCFFVVVRCSFLLFVPFFSNQQMFLRFPQHSFSVRFIGERRISKYFVSFNVQLLYRFHGCSSFFNLIFFRLA